MVMSKEIQIFDYSAGPLVAAVGEGDQPIFKAIEVCRILGIKNSRDALAGLDDDEKMTVGNTDTQDGRHGGARYHSWVTESGLYALIFKSRKAEAKRFRKWVTSEVLPALRKTGRYDLLESQVEQLKVEHKKTEVELLFSEMRCAELEGEIVAMRPADDEYMTSREFCDRFRVHDELGRSPGAPTMRVQARLIKLISEHYGAEVRKTHSAVFGKVNAYRLDVLREWAALFRHSSTSDENYRSEVLKLLGLQAVSSGVQVDISRPHRRIPMESANPAFDKAKVYALPFGKYKGMTLNETAAHDDGLLYLEWLSKQGFVNGRTLDMLETFLGYEPVVRDIVRITRERAERKASR